MSFVVLKNIDDIDNFQNEIRKKKKNIYNYPCMNHIRHSAWNID